MLAVPIKDDQDRLFGVLAVDTVIDQRNRRRDVVSTFAPKDIDFCQASNALVLPSLSGGHFDAKRVGAPFHASSKSCRNERRSPC